MKFRPLHDRIVVKPIEAEEKSAGGIIIPDTAKEKAVAGRGHRCWAGRPRLASSFPSTSRPVTGCCSENGQAPRSKSTARNS